MGIYSEAIQKLYVAYFNRPADPAGLDYWEKAVSAANGSTAAVSAAFAGSTEYKTAYANMDANHVVSQVYQNLFGHAPDLAGLDFWGKALGNKQMTVDDVVTQIAGGAQGSDLTAFSSKAAFASWFTGSLDTADKVLHYSGDAANAVAKSLVATVIDQASMDRAIAGGPTATVLSNTTSTTTPPFGASAHTTQTQLDVSKLGANYSAFELTSGSVIASVGNQTVTANGDLTITAAGYDHSASPIVYHGNLTVTEKATGSVTASADLLNLTVKASAGASTTATLLGDVRSAIVTLANTVDSTSSPTLDRVASVTIDTGATGGDAALKVLALAGNGSASVANADGSQLAIVDASALGGTLAVAGTTTIGLNYTSANSKAETIKLGAGIDNVTLNASTYGAVDTVIGLHLVTKADGSGLLVGTDSFHVGAAASFAKFTTTQTDIDLALKDAAAYAGAHNKPNLVFTLGGDTYVFQDKATPGVVDFADVLVKLVGTVNLDALVLALGAPVV
jgi:hypothetical protein